jgi:hypothetical protein
VPVVSGQNPFSYALQGLIIGLFLLGFTSTVFAFEREVWSTTDPQINLVHVFDGEINRKGKPTGFHHFSPRTDPARSRIKKVLAGPNKTGVYTALVEIFDRKRNQWKEKFSSLFPSSLTRHTLINGILHAYRNSELGTGRKWRGPSGLGFKIEGYLLKDGRIITAYPIYQQ